MYMKFSRLHCFSTHAPPLGVQVDESKTSQLCATSANNEAESAPVHDKYEVKNPILPRLPQTNTKTPLKWCHNVYYYKNTLPTPLKMDRPTWSYYNVGKSTCSSSRTPAANRNEATIGGYTCREDWFRFCHLYINRKNRGGEYIVLLVSCISLSACTQPVSYSVYVP